VVPVTVAEVDRVDQITRSPDGQTYTLLMVEPRPFDGGQDQVDQFLAKANAYLLYVQSGQLYQTVPEAQGRIVRVRLVCQDMPEAGRMQEALRAAAAAFDRHGVEFGVEVIPPQVLPQR
jgi:hypothetical protein